MLNTVRLFLTQNTTPEHIAVLTQCDACVTDFGWQNFDLPFVSILEQIAAGLTENDSAVQSIDTLYRDMLFVILKEHYIVLDDEDLSLSELVLVTQALKDCQYLEDAQLVLDTIRSDDDDVSKLCFILSMASALGPEWFLLRISQIHPGTLLKLEEHYVSQAALEQFEHLATNAKDTNIYTERLLLLLSLLGVEDINLTRLVRDGLAYGLPFSAYEQLLAIYLEQLPERNIVAELYAAALIAEEVTAPAQEAAKHLETYSADTAQTVRMRKLLQNLDVKLQNALIEAGQAKLGAPAN